MRQFIDQYTAVNEKLVDEVLLEDSFCTARLVTTGKRCSLVFKIERKSAAKATTTV